LEIDKRREAVPVPLLFVAPSVAVKFPEAVGVPEISPVEELTERPAGSPLAVKLVGLLVAVIWYENAVPRVPLALVVLVITGTAVSVRVSVAVPVPALFVALSVIVETPPTVGVPEIRPVVVFTVRPAGRPVAP
jgi:hypothetical protein